MSNSPWIVSQGTQLQYVDWFSYNTNINSKIFCNGSYVARYCANLNKYVIYDSGYIHGIPDLKINGNRYSYKGFINSHPYWCYDNYNLYHDGTSFVLIHSSFPLGVSPFAKYIDDELYGYQYWWTRFNWSNTVDKNGSYFNLYYFDRTMTNKDKLGYIYSTNIWVKQSNLNSPYGKYVSNFPNKGIKYIGDKQLSAQYNGSNYLWYPKYSEINVGAVPKKSQYICSTDTTSSIHFEAWNSITGWIGDYGNLNTGWYEGPLGGGTWTWKRGNTGISKPNISITSGYFDDNYQCMNRTNCYIGQVAIWNQ